MVVAAEVLLFPGSAWATNAGGGEWYTLVLPGSATPPSCPQSASGDCLTEPNAWASPGT